jgi:hypothetical protein
MKPHRNIWLCALILIMTGLTGCPAPLPAQIIQEPLTRPLRPVLPAIKAAELQCLSDETYFRLAARNRLARQYTEQLELIIDSTKDEGQ